jgi:MFS family permease
LIAVGHFRRWANASSVERSNTSLDTVLLGGALGSLFSILQCIASPIIGRASDRWGRRKTLLVTMVSKWKYQDT